MSSSRPVVRWPLGRSVLIIVLCLVLTGGGAGFLVWAYGFSAQATAEYTVSKVAADEAQAIHDKQETAKKRAAQAVVNERNRVAAEEARWAASGYSPAGDGVYYQFSDPSTFTCGYWNCSYVELMAPKGCPSALYIEAAITSNGVDIGMANHLASGVPEYGIVLALLEDYTGQGDGFRVTKVDCY